jgi:hypothetical protein
MMRGRKRQAKKLMKKQMVDDSCSFWQLMNDTKKIFEELLIVIRKISNENYK